MSPCIFSLPALLQALHLVACALHVVALTLRWVTAHAPYIEAVVLLLKLVYYLQRLRPVRPDGSGGPGA